MKLLKKPITTAFFLAVIFGVVIFFTSSNKTLISPSSDQESHKSSQVEQSTYNNEKKTYDTQIIDELSHKNEKEKSSVKIIDQDEKIENDINKQYTETPFMPKMANETLKAELGRSSWRLFHTILARYPDNPSKPEIQTLKQYIDLFAQVYPCGDCARHFTQLLAKYPPQLSSRKNAAVWGCHIHNKVNERLEKPIYDCTTILEDYDCGCGSDELEEDSTLNNESLDHLKSIKIEEKIDLQLGG